MNFTSFFAAVQNSLSATIYMNSKAYSLATIVITWRDAMKWKNKQN